MQIKIARFFSIVFNPYFIPAFALLVVFNAGTYMDFLPFAVKRIAFYVVIILTCLIPLAFIPLFKYQNLIKDYFMSSTRDRYVPLLFNALCSGLGAYFLYHISIMPLYIVLFMVSIGILSLISLLISLKWKISNHMMGMGGLTGVILGLIQWNPASLPFYLILSIIIAGFVGSSRLLLKAHTPLQVYAGYLAGVIIVYGTVMFA